MAIKPKNQKAYKKLLILCGITAKKRKLGKMQQQIADDLAIKEAHVKGFSWDYENCI